MPHAFPARILFIDAYDSFTNNIISLLETRLHVEVTVIKIDDHIDDFATFLKPFAAVAAGPGPGDPRNLKDVGLFRELWQLDEHDVLPVLGICLGFQSLVLLLEEQSSACRSLGMEFLETSLLMVNPSSTVLIRWKQSSTILFMPV